VSNVGHRSSSLFVGVLLIVLGLVFFADRFYPHFGIGHLIRLYWPVLIILWGVAKLIDHTSSRHTGEPRGPLLSGGEAALLILLALVLATFVFRDWLRDEFPGIEIHLPAFGRSLTRTRSLPPVEIPAGAHVSIETGRGYVKVVGADGDELRVSVHESAIGRDEAATDDRIGGVDAVIDRIAGGYRIHPTSQSGWRSPGTVDFDVQVPKSALVTANTSHGDIDIRNMDADVSVESQSGDVRIESVAGNVRVHGRGENLNITDVAGDAAVDGDYLGDTHVRRTAGTLHVKSAREELTVAKLTGELAVDSGDLSISGAAGYIKVATHDKDVAVQGAASQLDIASSHGDIDVHFARPPRDPVSITSDSGDVELTLPAQSTFQLSAVSRSGDVECDFEDASVRHARETDVERIDGTFGPPSDSPAPKVSVATSYGAIHVRESK